MSEHDHNASDEEQGGGFESAKLAASLAADTEIESHEGAELVHVPREEQNEQKEKIDSLVQVDLSRIIIDAAAGRGDVKPDEQESNGHEYKAHNYSDQVVLKDGYGLPVDDTDGFVRMHSATLNTEQGRIHVRSLKNEIAGGVRVMEDFRRIEIDGKTPDGQDKHTIVSIELGKDGKRYVGTPTISERVGRESEGSRWMEPNEITDMKHLLVDSFGLKYAPPQAPRYFQVDKTKYSDEVINKVGQRILELKTAGLDNVHLRRALVKEFHTDVNSDPLAEEAMQYLSAIDLDQPLN